MSTIDDLERKVQRLTDQLNAAKVALRDARIAAMAVGIGDVALGRSGDEYRVTRIEPYSGGATIYGNPRKKNGEWSKVERRVHGWPRKLTTEPTS